MAVFDAINDAFVGMLHIPEAMDVERPLSVYRIGLHACSSGTQGLNLN